VLATIDYFHTLDIKSTLLSKEHYCSLEYWLDKVVQYFGLVFIEDIIIDTQTDPVMHIVPRTVSGTVI
jgi:hypothetical protein